MVKNVFWGVRFCLCACGLCTGCLHPHAHETFKGLPVGMCAGPDACILEGVRRNQSGAVVPGAPGSSQASRHKDGLVLAHVARCPQEGSFEAGVSFCWFVCVCCPGVLWVPGVHGTPVATPVAGASGFKCARSSGTSGRVCTLRASMMALGFGVQFCSVQSWVMPQSCPVATHAEGCKPAQHPMLHSGHRHLWLNPGNAARLAGHNRSSDLHHAPFEGVTVTQFSRLISNPTQRQPLAHTQDAQRPGRQRLATAAGTCPCVLVMASSWGRGCASFCCCHVGNLFCTQRVPPSDL